MATRDEPRIREELFNELVEELGRFVEKGKRAQEQINRMTQNPTCRNCWDKGFASHYEVRVVGNQRRYHSIEKKFCQECFKGRRMEREHIIREAYHRGYRDGAEGKFNETYK